MEIKDHLRTLSEDPSDRQSRKAVGRLVARRVAFEILKPDMEDKPVLSSIAPDIIKEYGSRLPVETQKKLLPVLRSIVDGSLDDDELSEVTLLIKRWQAGERRDGEDLFDALQVPLSRRVRSVLGRFGSQKNKISPGDLLTELYLKLQERGFSSALEDRKQFFLYAEKILKNHLLDAIRSDGRLKRGLAVQQPLDEILSVLQGSGKAPDALAFTPQSWIDLSNAVDTLPEELRTFVQARFVEGLDFEEIGARCKISRPTAARRQQKALALLRQILTAGGYSSSDLV